MTVHPRPATFCAGAMTGGDDEDGAGKGEASEAQAQSQAARQLLDGELTAEIVALHGAVFSSLSATAAGSAGSSNASNGLHLNEDTTRASFMRRYQLGVQLLASLGPGAAPLAAAQHGPGSAAAVGTAGLSRQVDDATLGGHLYRLCSEHVQMAKAAASTAADAAAAAEGKAVAGPGKGGRKAAPGMSTKGAALLEEGPPGFDIQAPCVEELVLLQVGQEVFWLPACCLSLA